jgi:hypothetical protein
LTDGRYRYVEWVEMSDPEKVVARELYDHQSDPQEMQNLMLSGEGSEVSARLAALLDRGNGWSTAKPPVQVD